MMLYEKILRNKTAIKRIIAKIAKLKLARKANLMEVCGTHTYSFFRFGLRGLLKDYVNLISGPGCPVCITQSSYIDKAIYLAQNPNNVITTFGDLVKVRGTNSSLEEERARGSKINIVYSPSLALELAQKNKNLKVIFLSVGFETTSPLIASIIQQAEKMRINNFYILAGNRIIPPAMEILCQDKDINIDGFICPGHVSAIIGQNAYKKIVTQYKKPCVICGFEPLDMVLGIYMLLKQIKQSKPKLENEYSRIVKPNGNPKALKILSSVFEVRDAGWRGLGILPKSGLFLRPKYKRFDAQNFIKIKIPEAKPPKACLCAQVIKGRVNPKQCTYFRKKCSPQNPIGPCMVSFEGTCRIYYEYAQ